MKTNGSARKSCTCTFTVHALERIFERLSITPEKIAEMVGYGGPDVLPIGHDGRRKHRKHVLCFSDTDNHSFVVVIDVRNNQVITVLYPDFDNHCRIAPDTLMAFEQARRHQI